MGVQLAGPDGRHLPLYGADAFLQLSARLRKEHKGGDIPPIKIRELVQTLAPPNRETLRIICELLNVASKPEWTASSKMDPEKFALCVMPQIASIFAVMIDCYHEVFLD